jgi:protein-L-isoaspartate(D-aspartate) O-methyltransferase
MAERRAAGHHCIAALLICAAVPFVLLPATGCDGGAPAPGAEEPAAAATEAPAETPVAASPVAGPAGEEGGKERPLAWERPRFREREAERRRMVETQIEGRGIKDEAVLDALLSVPRHRFCTPATQNQAYADHALPIEEGQTISQPYIVAFMTDLLDLEAGDRVLEVGTGSGYQAAVLSEITPYVYTIEIIRELHDSAAERLKELGYDTITVKNADGYYGWGEHAPFDAIIVTAAAGHVPPPLIQQLKPGGRLIIPVGGTFETQQLVLVTKDEDEDLKARSVLPVRFVPMTGRAQGGG